jgi:hypothetical protein
MKKLLNSIWDNWIIILVAIVLFVAIGLAVGVTLTKTDGAARYVEHIFVDINGDGRLDLLVSGDVIFNLPLVTPLPTQATSP